MSSSIRFDNPALQTAYETAAQRLESLPKAHQEQLLATIAGHLHALDGRDDVSALELQAAAHELVSIPALHGMKLAAPRLDASPSPLMDATVVVLPTSGVDPVDGLPTIDGRRPTTWQDAGDAAYRLAAAIDRLPEGNLFADLSVEQRGMVLAQAMALAHGKVADLGGLDALSADQRIQLRSSAFTIISELIAGGLSDKSPPGRAQLAEMVAAASDMARAEPVLALRESMVFGLYRYQTKLPAKQVALSQALMRDLMPQRPPYDVWLADGKVTVDHVVDGDAITVSEQAWMYEDLGFERISDNDGVITMRGTEGRGDKEAVVEIRIREKDADIFANMASDDVDIVYYSGHSSYGRNVPRNLQRAPDGTGANKLVVFGTCFGKDNLIHARQEYPEAMLMGNFRSSTSSDDRRCLRVLMAGIAGRKSWAGISRSLGSPESWGGNWVSPADIMLRRRILDDDGDGRADILDRLFDVNTHNVTHDIRRAFTPQDPGHPPHRLQALHGVSAANWMNRGVGAYNEAVRDVNRDSEVSCAGFYDGGQAGPPVRFTATTLPDGATGWTMEINHWYAHMPEEALRAVATFEFAMHLSRANEDFALYDQPAEAKINALMAVAFTLSHDLGFNDGLVWDAIIEHYGLPAGLKRYELETWAAKDNASYRDAEGGSADNARDYLIHLEEHDPDLARALQRDDGGG